MRLNARRGSEQYQATNSRSRGRNALAAGGRQAVQHGRLGVFEVGERRDALRRLLRAGFVDLGIGDGLLPVADSFTDISPLLTSPPDGRSASTHGTQGIGVTEDRSAPHTAALV